MESSPEYEVPSCAVPESAEEHGDHEVSVLGEGTFSVSAEGGCRGSLGARLRGICAIAARIR